MLIDFGFSSPAQCAGVLISYDWNIKHIEGVYRYEPPQDKTNKMAMRPAKTQISLGMRVFAVRSMGS